MSKEHPTNIAASVRQRLFNLALAHGDNFEHVAVSYGLDRMLYRLSLSPQAHRFILKGATMFRYWLPDIHRPTMDVDLLGKGFKEVDEVVAVFADALHATVDDDGLVFIPATLRGNMIREGNQYHGVRIQLEARLAGARLCLQFDVGFGDIVMPPPEMMDLPPMLPFPAARLATYSRYSMVAEKFHAMTSLGAQNSRMKDFFDIWTLSRHLPFEGETLRTALTATFDRRNTPIPTALTLALTPEFTESASKGKQWTAFLRRIGEAAATPLPEVAAALAGFLLPVTSAITAGEPFDKHWPPNGPWL